MKPYIIEIRPAGQREGWQYIRTRGVRDYIGRVQKVGSTWEAHAYPVTRPVMSGFPSREAAADYVAEMHSLKTQ